MRSAMPPMMRKVVTGCPSKNERVTVAPRREAYDPTPDRYPHQSLARSRFPIVSNVRVLHGTRAVPKVAGVHGGAAGRVRPRATHVGAPRGPRRDADPGRGRP